MLTFTGDVSCFPYGQVNFVHAVTGLSYDSEPVIEADVSNEDYESITMIEYVADLQVETTDSVTEVDSANSNHEFTQTITNNGPDTVKDLYFDLSTSCYNVSSVATSGTATDNGNYDIGGSHWSGVLESGQTLVLTYNGAIGCGAGQAISFESSINNIANDGNLINDLNSSNEDYIDNDTQIISTTSSSDGAVSIDVTSGTNYIPGGTVNYQLSLRNNGPDPIDLTRFDGSGPNPFDRSLFIVMTPFDVSFVSGSSSNNDITCSSFPVDTNDPMASPIFPNHPDHNLLACSYTGSNSLNSGDSVSTTVSYDINGISDLDFQGHLISGWVEGDPQLPDMQSIFMGTGSCADGGYNDLIDCYSGLSLNNYQATRPISDITVTSELVQPVDVTPGQTIYYDVTLTNDGPMPFDLSLFSSGPAGLLGIIYPSVDLTYSGDNQADIDCLDYGPGSIAFIGLAGQDHPDHQIANCYYTGSGQIVPVDGSYTIRLAFTVDGSVGEAFDIYFGNNGNDGNGVPTTYDPDVVNVLNQFSTATGDILDSIASSNGNFSKTSYPVLVDDNDGIPAQTADAAPNDGAANNDGVRDSEEPNVASFVSPVTNNPVVLAVPSDCSITAVDLDSESANNVQDGAYIYPLGLFNFTLNCGTPGYTATITQYYYDQSDQGYILRKYDDNNDSYSTIDAANIAETQIDSRNVITAAYDVTDGQVLDLDQTEDGQIRDPAGLAIEPVDSSENDSNGGIGTKLVNLASTGQSIAIAIVSSLALLIASIYLYKRSRKRG